MTSRLRARASPDLEAPFIWQSKSALRAIENSTQIRSIPNAKLVYYALTWLASDEKSPTFTAEISAIARKASLGYRSTWEALKALEKIGLVCISRPKLRSAATITLCTTCRTLCTTRKAFCRGRLSAFADSTEEQGKKKNGGPLTTSERITLEKQLGICRARLKALEGDTAEQWQRDEHPELIQEKQSIRAEITRLENALLTS